MSVYTTAISPAAVQYSDYPSTAATTINSGGSMFVSSGEVAEGVIVNRDGFLHVLKGGTVNNATVNTYGSLCISSGGVANSTTAAILGYIGVFNGGVANNTILNHGGGLVVFRGGVANDSVMYHAALHISGRGRIYRTQINASAYVYVFSGGIANSTFVNSIGYIRVSSGGSANSTFVNNGGYMRVFEVGSASATFVSSGGSMHIFDTAIATDTHVYTGGSMWIDSGGTARGIISLEENTVCIAHEGAIIDFTAANQTLSGTPLINDWSRITDKGASYTLAVTANQALGTYALAGGAADFDKTITVKVAQKTIGTLQIGETLTVSGVSYTLNKNTDLLSLTVSDPAAVPPPPQATTAEIILTISDANHPSFGATGGWKVQTDQTIVWQDLSTLSGDYQVLGQGYTVAGKAMTDIYVYSASNKYIGVYTTDDTGAITGFDGVFSTENALMQVGLGDFNADGVSDLLLRTADGYLGFYANGAFTAVQGLGTEWQVNALGDVNGDGTTDMIISHTPGGYVGAYLIGKDGSITWGDLGSTEGGIEIVGAGDFNADGTDDVLVKSGSYYGAWLCGNGAVTGFFGIGTFNATVQDIADYNADGTDDILFRTADGIIGAALITGPDSTTWTQYGALGSEWSTKGAGIL